MVSPQHQRFLAGLLGPPVAVGLVIALAMLMVKIAGAERGRVPVAGAAATSAKGEDKPAPRRTITIGWAGDTVPGSRYGQPVGDTLLRSVAPLLRRPDLTLVNLEGTFGRTASAKCGTPSPNCYAFQATPESAHTLRRAGVDLVNIANNHSLDYGAQGQLETIRALYQAKVAWTGMPAQVRVMHRGGVSVGVVGMATYPWSTDLDNAAAVRSLVGQARELADIVVVLFHGGAEGSDRGHTPVGGETYLGERRGNLRAFARRAIDAGADLVLGSGPHVLRGIERYKRRLIAYSMGNLAGPKVFSTSGDLALSAVLTVTLEPDGTVRSGRISSLKLDDGLPAPDPSGAAARYITKLSRADFGPNAVTVTPRGRLDWTGARDAV